jgi:hypothetical protein
MPIQTTENKIWGELGEPGMGWKVGEGLKRRKE